MIKRQSVLVFVAIFCLACLTGCTPKEPPFWTNGPFASASLAPPADWSAMKPGGTWHTSATPTVGVIEFDEQGKLWPCGGDSARPYCQLNKALDLIRNVRQKLPDREVVVLAYVHGWHHNASKDSYNFQNFQLMINCLNWGDPADDNVIEAKAYQPTICTGMRPAKDKFYVGVYLGWRGESMKALTVLSVLNRHDDAAVVADQRQDDGIERTVLKLSKAAKFGGKPARFVLLGHSFGGLIVNRITTDIYEKRLADTKRPINPSACADLDQPFTPFADVVVVINPADSSLHVADLVTRFQSLSTCPVQDNAAGLKRPMLISLHTSSDSVTDALGSFALKIAPWVDRSYMKQISSDWANRGNQHLLLDEPSTVAELRRNTVSHVPYLRNLCYLDQPDFQDPICLGLNDKLYQVKRTAYTSAIPNTPPPVPLNQNYSIDPFFHGAYELLTSVCVTDEEQQMVDGLWSKEHQFEADFAAKSCNDPELKEKRDKLRTVLLVGLKPYLAFPNDTGMIPDDLLLNLYRRYDPGTRSYGRMTYDKKTHQANLDRGCIASNGLDSKSGESPWNQSPVWTINVSYEILQKHSGFWNTDAFSIITGIANQFEVVPDTDDYDHLPTDLSQPELHNDRPLNPDELHRNHKRWEWPWSSQGQQQQQQQGRIKFKRVKRPVCP